MSSSKQRFTKRKKKALPSDLSARATEASPRCPSVPALLCSAPVTADGTKGCPVPAAANTALHPAILWAVTERWDQPIFKIKMLSARSAMTPGRLSPSQGEQAMVAVCPHSSGTRGTRNTEPPQSCSSPSLHQGWHPNFSSTVSPWPTPSVWHSRTWTQLQDGFDRICGSAHSLLSLWQLWWGWLKNQSVASGSHSWLPLLELPQNLQTPGPPQHKPCHTPRAQGLFLGPAWKSPVTGHLEANPAASSKMMLF